MHKFYAEVQGKTLKGEIGRWSRSGNTLHLSKEKDGAFPTEQEAIDAILSNGSSGYLYRVVRVLVMPPPVEEVTVTIMRPDPFA